jgi:hypothetical protein
MYANFGDVPLSRQLSQARGSNWLVLPAASAVELLAALNGVECPAGDVTAFVANEHGPDDAMEEAAAVGAALRSGALMPVKVGSPSEPSTLCHHMMGDRIPPNERTP